MIDVLLAVHVAASEVASKLPPGMTSDTAKQPEGVHMNKPSKTRRAIKTPGTSRQREEKFAQPVMDLPGARVGDFIFTASGRKIYPLDARPNEIDLSDIAHSLSNLCRWTGHCEWFYPVALHAILVADQVDWRHPELALAALHHDDAEAYLLDLNRPMKKYCTFGPLGTYTEVEHRLLGVIFEALGVPPLTTADWEKIKEADNWLLRTELDQLMSNSLKHDCGVKIYTAVEGLNLKQWKDMKPEQFAVRFKEKHEYYVKKLKGVYSHVEPKGGIVPGEPWCNEEDEDENDWDDSLPGNPSDYGDN